MTAAPHEELAGKLVEFLETGILPGGLFRPDVFCDYTMPTWRLQAAGVDVVVALRHRGHPATGRVLRSRLDPTPTGFVLEFEEEWEQDGQPYYSRELLRADVVNGAIAELAVYCTGDWDRPQVQRHTATIALLRR